MSLDIRKDEQQYAQKAEDRTKDTKKYHQHSQACESMPWMDDAVWFTIQLATPRKPRASMAGAIVGGKLP
jgi:hypothetical protein